MKPGWVLTKAGGVRYDGVHFSASPSPRRVDILDIQIHSHLPMMTSSCFTCSDEPEHSRVPYRVDTLCPPRGWEYLGSSNWPETSHSWKHSSGHQIFVLTNSAIFIPFRESKAIWANYEFSVDPPFYAADLFRLIDSGVDSVIPEPHTLTIDQRWRDWENHKARKLRLLAGG